MDPTVRWGDRATCGEAHRRFVVQPATRPSLPDRSLREGVVMLGGSTACAGKISAISGRCLGSIAPSASA